MYAASSIRTPQRIPFRKRTCFWFDFNASPTQQLQNNGNNSQRSIGLIPHSYTKVWNKQLLLNSISIPILYSIHYSFRTHIHRSHRPDLDPWGIFQWESDLFQMQWWIIFLWKRKFGEYIKYVIPFKNTYHFPHIQNFPIEI